MQTRYSFATMMLSAGEDIGWVQNMLGHSLLQMIFQRYYSWIPQKTRTDGQALQAIFTSLANRAATQEKLLQYQTFLTLALKAQAQSRATIQALTDLEFLRTTAFVKQANIANGPQQVNNNTQPEDTASRTQEIKTEQSKLSSIEDTRNERKTLDFGAAATAGRTDTAMETVGKVNRSQKRKGQAQSRKKPL